MSLDGVVLRSIDTSNDSGLSIWYSDVELGMLGPNWVATRMRIPGYRLGARNVVHRPA